jgi:hypothetical protein
MNDLDLVDKFIVEHLDDGFFIPDNGVFMSNIANTPEYLRKYFEWKGKNVLS